MRRSGWGRTAVGALSAVLALGLVACGDDDDEGPQTSATTAAPAPRGSATVTIDMIDHAFQVSGPLIAGGTLKISNKGDEFHMMGIARLKPGKTLSDLEKVLAEEGGGPPPAEGGASTTVASGGATTTVARGATTTTAAGGGGQEERQDPTADIVDDVGLPGTFMGPGEAIELTVPNFEPGTYALVCFIPTEGEGAPHFTKGMIDQLEVVAGAAPPPPTADATYKLAPGKAIEGPATLTAGRHTLRFDAAPGSEQLEPGLARLNQVATLEQVNTALNSLFEGEEPPAEGSAKNVPGQLIFSGFDLNKTTTFFLTVDLEPGNHVIVAEDTDEEGPSDTPTEFISVRVT